MKFPEFKNLLPTRRGRRLALFNEKAFIPIGRVMVLMRDRQLTEVMRDMEFVKKMRNTMWLSALELLERRGLLLGLEPAELAAELGITKQGARRIMNKAEHHIWAVYGVTISFPKRNEPWKLLNHIEITHKYRRVMKDMGTRAKRARMYIPIAGHHGTEDGALEMPLFQFDFSQKELPDEAQA